MSATATDGLSPADPTGRFSDRVVDYVRSRPSYPAAMIDGFRTRWGLRPEHVVVDVGSGTGLLSRLFLANGNRVIGVEPNEAMREAARPLLDRFPSYEVVAGRAEATGLPEGLADLLVAGQSFHWFDPGPTSIEFRRLLRPAGRVALVWNTRRRKGTPFLDAYEAFLIRWGTDYTSVRGRYPGARELEGFFAPRTMELGRWENRQDLDLEGLRCRIRSSSYMPGPDHPAHGQMLRAIETLFREHQRRGAVRLEYLTELYIGAVPA